MVAGACSGCGSTSHFLRDCLSNKSQHVREVVRATVMNTSGGRDQARKESPVPAASLEGGVWN